MGLFEEIVKENFLLSELHQSRQADVVKAINNMLRVIITYNDGKGGKGKNMRYIMPVAFGLDKNGKKVISAFQSMGSTKRGVPKWKFFFYDKISSWDNGKKTFKDQAQRLIDLGLNTEPSGDKRMTKIFAITPIANQNVQVDASGIPIDSEPVLKADITQKWRDKLAASKSSQKYLSANKSRQSSIDNNKDKSYFKNKVEAPPTQPMKKTDITGTETQKTVQEPEKQQPNLTPTSGPVTKTDIKQLDNTNNNNQAETEKDLKDNEITKTFNDLTDRMDNLYKNEED